MSKLPIPTGPSGIARQFIMAGTRERVEVKPKPERIAALRATIAPKRRDIPPEPVAAEAPRPKSGSDGGEVAVATKAAKVKAWREANPEAYADQKRRSIARRKAQKEQGK